MIGRCPYCSQPRPCPHGYRRKPNSGGAWIWLYFLALGALAGLVKIIGHHLVAAGVVAGCITVIVVLGVLVKANSPEVKDRERRGELVFVYRQCLLQDRDYFGMDCFRMVVKRDDRLLVLAYGPRPVRVLFADDLAD